MSDYGMPKPPGHPATLRHAVKNLRSIASDTHKHGRYIDDERRGIQHAWTDANGDAAAGEATTLAGFARTYSDHIGNGAAALSTYAGKLDDAQGAVKKLQHRAATENSNLIGDYMRKYPSYPAVLIPERSDFKSDWSDKLAALHREYHTVMHDLDLDAYTCATTLSKETPDATSHGKPGGVYQAVYNSITRSLPLLHAHQEAKEYAQIVKDGKIDGKERAKARAIAADLAKHKNDPAYLQEFFNSVPAGSVAKLPEALAKGDAGKPLNGEDKTIIGDFGTALATVSRIGGSASNGYTGSGYDTAKHALGADYEKNIVGIGLLVKYSSGKWNSRLIAELGEAALRWRQTHHTHANLAGNYAENPNDDWCTVWGGNNLAAIDPAVNILDKIVSTRDDWAARKLASDKLPPNLAKDPYEMTGVDRNGHSGTYVDLLITPDWSDKGAGAGGLLKLATEAVRTGPAGRQSAQIMKYVIDDTAAWEANKKKLHDALSDPDTSLLMGNSGVPTDYQRWGSADLGPAMTHDFAHMASQYVASLATDSTNSAAGTPVTFVDPVTGTTNVYVQGGNAEKFMQSFVANDKDRLVFLGVAQNWAQRAVTYGLDHPGSGLDASGYAHRAGWLYGTTAHAYQDATQVSQDQAQTETERDLKLSRDLLNIAVGSVPGAGSAASFGFTHLTDAMFDHYDDAVKAHAENAATHGADFGNTIESQGYSVVAMAMHDTHHWDNVRIEDGSNLTFGQCFNADGTVKKEDAAAVEQWIANHNQAGQSLVDEYESAFDHNK